MPLFNPASMWRGSASISRAYRGGLVVFQTAPPTTPITIYSQDFSVNITDWAAQSNASSLVRDTARHVDGALRWTATASGMSVVRRAGEVAVTPGWQVTVTAKVSHNGAVARGFYLSCITFSSDYSAQNNFDSPWQYVDPGATGGNVTLTLTVPASRTLLGMNLGFTDPAAGEQAWLDTFTVTRPG